jgi:hypothetical protein
MKKLLLTSIAALFLATGAAHAQSGYRPNYDPKAHEWQPAESPAESERASGGFGVDACYFSKKPDPKPEPAGGWNNCVSMGYFKNKADCELLRKNLMEQGFKVGKCKIIKD